MESAVRERWRVSNAVFETVGVALAWLGALAGAGHESTTASMALLWSAVWALQCVPYYRSVDDHTNAGLAMLRAAGLFVWVLR
jgi:hypothetical protein